MLKSLDVLIGLTVIMLALSMGVTMLTQFATTVLNSRGRHLKRGIMDLLNQIDPALATKAVAAEQSVAGRVADAILTHPLISATGRRLGTVVHREELTRLLLFLTDDTAALDEDAKAVLKQMLARNGIADPAGTLKRIRELSLKLETEKSEPGRQRPADNGDPAGGEQRFRREDQQLVRPGDRPRVAAVHGARARHHVRGRCADRRRPAGRHHRSRQSPLGR